ncbi:hypothetical protein BO71DRAFT_481624 [Aspergillus ellipticus CBS 707.79]|uniref:Utp8 beta-propeller domain-containing protein n=1 Tax=Aspergillus ellipticus CBS 707.79 TaxID=1448320 RepID=A0A319DHI4_9EURO|nr:hypothetical protein BO71DRAFT_481624 [Aspergillus ellipticus CBS 707.79]
MDLQPPSVLAHLPRPLHASTGKTHIAEVYSLADSKKRKRHEVVVAVDGEAVNIYNIQTPKLVTSYAVPPQSSFSCQPCSVRRKVPSQSAVRRQTYVAVKQQIKSFVEENGNGFSAPVISSSSYAVKDSDSPAVFLGIVPTESEEDGSFDVLAVHQDGRVRRLSSDLETQQWSLRHSEVSKTSATHEIRSCFLVEFEDAKKSLFKRRQDLAALAFANLTETGVDEPSVLLLVSEPIGSTQTKLSEVKVQMFSVPANASSQGDESQKMRHLLTVNMPEVEGQEAIESSNSQWYFHAGSAGLNLSFDKGYINFDLSQYKPTVTSKFILDNEEFSSVLRISPQSVIGAGQSMIAVYDTQYKSVQRSIPVEDVAAGSSGSGARTTFVSYFAKLGVAVAAKNNALLAFDLSASHSAAPSLKRPRDGLLIDAIGRGIGSSASKKHRTEDAILGLTTPKQAEQWNKLTVELRQCAESKNADGFDRAVKGYFGKAMTSQDTYVNPEKTLFLLSFIFSLKDDAASEDKLSASSSFRVSIDLWPQRTCQWLTQIGHLSLSNVEIALRRSIKPRILPPLPTGSFAQALVDSDPSFQRLIDILQGRNLSSPDELAYILKLLINTARSRAITLDEETPKALTNGEDSAPSALTTTTNTEASLENIFIALNTTLQKLYRHPLPAITTSIRSTLSRTEIISMVHHLRLSLATGGYTSRFTEPAPVPVPAEQTNPPLSLDIIINLLNASVDAIGPSGWISATGIDDSFARDQELITDMKSEISAALAGVEEATYLKGILHEYLRYANSAIRSATTTVSVDASGAETPASALVRHEKLNGADLMVFGAPEEGDEGFDGDATGKLLPLSLKAASNEVSKTKIKLSTGEVKTRSSREIGYLRRKAVGKYSFERLVV